MSKKSIFIGFLISFLILIISAFSSSTLSGFISDFSSVVTIFTGIIIIFEIVKYKDVSVSFGLKDEALNWISISNEMDVDFYIEKLVMIIDDIRLNIYIFNKISARKSNKYVLSKNAKIIPVCGMSNKIPFDENSFYFNLMDYPYKVYFEIHTPSGIYIPKTGQIGLLKRCVKFLEAKSKNSNKIEVELK
ncbi:hypothetical protein [Vibrio cholerae]|uniref:hypothetical protein n=1 Tax=Vibrio cholerae TaxID=666 RepID=UPI0011D85044|nr:hypothetical protein [Vibrio cholerae]EGR2536832.1 hypothetical protein [Vibrio cholerae]TXZ65665.1 hypothetical protein FXE41_04180 [Vibrio cholerae]GIB35574.1 hypothetical protein VCSRO44_2527 [Vibrio cholerae]